MIHTVGLELRNPTTKGIIARGYDQQLSCQLEGAGLLSVGKDLFQRVDL